MSCLEKRAEDSALRRCSLTALAHAAVARHVGEGSVVVDATVGNGHDTLFLAARVGGTGRVHGFDVQAPALEAARSRLVRAGLLDRVTLYTCGHQEMDRVLPAGHRGGLAAVMFNLGYLPGSDKQVVTRAHTTTAAVRASLEWLQPGGMASILVYRGHPGGQEEAEGVAGVLRSLDPGRFAVGAPHRGAHPTSPLLHVVCKR